MNKQEALKNIEKLDGLTIKDKDFNFDIEMIPKGETLEIIEQLDEPEKPVVPQFVADWLEVCKENLALSLASSMNNIVMSAIKQPDETIHWVAHNSETFAKAWLFGYEVEKEKLYVVFQAATKEYLYTNVFGELRSACVSREFVEESEEYHFTQAELEGLNYWKNPAFEVKEVEE